jgi:hypothetical protein
LIILPGDCYLINHGGSCNHFFYVISAPDKFPQGRLVIVPITTISKEKSIDYSCVVSAGEHASCKADSFAFYRGAQILSLRDMEKLIGENKAWHRPPPADDNLLRRLRDGAKHSEELRDSVHDELYLQGILPPL